MGLNSQSIFQWAVSQEVTGVLQWLGAVGIPFAVWKAWTAASSAQKAELAVAAFQKRLSLANVAHTYSQLELVRNLVAAGELTAAMSVVGILKRTVLQMAKDLQNSTSPAPSIPQGPKNIRIVELQLGRAIRSDGKFNASVLDAAIRGLGDVLLDWEGIYFEQRPGV